MEKTLKKDDIKKIINSLARSQVFYSRLYQTLDEEDYEVLESMNFESAIDLILYNWIQLLSLLNNV